MYDDFDNLLALNGEVQPQVVRGVQCDLRRSHVDGALAAAAVGLLQGLVVGQDAAGKDEPAALPA